MTSPIFRTTSAIFQSDMARLIKQGRLGEAAAMATQAERNADPNALVGNALQQYGARP